MSESLRLCPEGCLLLEHHRYCAWHGRELRSLVGLELGKFVLQEGIAASGSFRAVYAARHRVQRNLRVTVEILRPPYCYRREIVDNFLRVAGILQRIRNPQVPEILECSNRPWPHVVSHLPTGRTLDEELAAQRRDGDGMPRGLHLKTGRLVLEGIARGLAACHRQGLVHRNLKPSNVLLAEIEDESDDRNRVRILDWIIAQEELASPAPGERPAGGTLAHVGTPEFMAPEQFRGRFDARTDIYQFGLVAFELLAGEAAYISGPASSAVAAWQSIHEHQRPRSLRRLRRDAPRRLCRLIECCLRKRPERRYRSGVELLLGFEELDLPWHERWRRRLSRLVRRR